VSSQVDEQLEPLNRLYWLLIYSASEKSIGQTFEAAARERSMSPTSGRIENILLIVLVQLVVIIAAARLFSLLFRRLGQPLVCGEIAAGLVLGPSVFGGIFPSLFHRVFDPAVGPVFSVMSQIGLILLMFLIGLEFDFGHLKQNGRAAFSISAAGIVLPFGLGLALGRWLHYVLQLSGDWLNLALFMAAAMSITAIPILGRIMLELNINRTRIGSLTISAAAADDATGWIILALVTAIAQSRLQPAKLFLMVGETIAFAALMVWIIRPRLKRWAAYQLRDNQSKLTLTGLTLLLVFVLLSAIATNFIGIFSIFGAFLLGAILYDEPELKKAVQERISDFVTAFFLPIFFTYTGLRTDIGTMTGARLWMMCALVLITAVVGKFGGCFLAARLNGLPWREASMVGVMMNTRALMELIVINIGYDLGVVPKNLFFMLVLMAVVTTYMTAPVLRRLTRSSELESQYLSSEFANRLKAAGAKEAA
jgi:Kef-type K+ transport system membrane component KefB